MLGFVYVLLLSNGKYYVGSTRDLEKRILKHQNGGVPSTKAFRPVELIFLKQVNSYSDARIIEIKLKNMKSRSYIENYFVNNG